MSVDEDTELQDLLTQTLEANGSFAKIRAQLRASIFLALEEDISLQKKDPLLNRKVKTSLESEEGRIMFCIVREFLEYFDLDFSLAVYEPETYLGLHYEFRDREQLIKDLNVPRLSSNSNAPILSQIVKFCRQWSSTTNGSDMPEQNSLKNVTLDNKPEENRTYEVTTPTIIKDIEASIGAEIPEEESVCKNLTNSLSNITLDLEKMTDQSTTSDLEVSPPILKDSKHSGKEKIKLSGQKIDKGKSRNAPDLPPISGNKQRSNEMLLPPLYTKEFKEMNSQRELEKMFDLEALDNYEEDFMSESEIDLVLNKEVSEKNDKCVEKTNGKKSTSPTSS